MQVYDLIMIVVLVAATAWGVYKGLAWQIASIASIVFSYLVAFQFRGPLAAQIKADPPWNVFLAMLLLYLGVSLVVWIGFRMVKETIDRVKLHEFDRHVGGVFGLAVIGGGENWLTELSTDDLRDLVHLRRETVA